MKKLLLLSALMVGFHFTNAQGKLTLSEFYEDQATLLVKSEIIEVNGDVTANLVKWLQLGMKNSQPSVTDKLINGYRDIEVRYKGTPYTYRFNVIIETKEGKIRASYYDAGKIKKSNPNLFEPAIITVDKPFKQHFKKEEIGGVYALLGKDILEEISIQLKQIKQETNKAEW